MKLVALVIALATIVGFRAPAGAVTTVAAPTPPATQRVTYTYKTYLEPGRLGGGSVGNLNENFGTLQLTFTPDKIISGTYRPDYGNFTNVTGGLTGPRSFWLSFGSGNVRMNGHFTTHGLFADTAGVSATGRYARLHAQFQHA